MLIMFLAQPWQTEISLYLIFLQRSITFSYDRVYCSLFIPCFQDPSKKVTALSLLTMYVWLMTFYMQIQLLPVWPGANSVWHFNKFSSKWNVMLFAIIVANMFFHETNMCLLHIKLISWIYFSPNGRAVVYFNIFVIKWVICNYQILQYLRNSSSGVLHKLGDISNHLEDMDIYCNSSSKLCMSHLSLSSDNGKPQVPT